MLQAANIDLFSTLVAKAQNRECQNQKNLLFPSQINPVKVSQS